MLKVKRKYDSAHRKLLAGKTQDQILESARSLFSDRGYGRTSMEDIAAAAGVAVPTVYASFGGKRAILLHLLDRMEKAADASALVKALKDRAGDQRAQLRAFIDFSVRLFTEDGGVVRIAELAGLGDPDIAALWETGTARRLETCRRLLAGWEKRGILRRGLTELRGVDILWAISGPEFYGMFVRGRAWTPAEFSGWLFQLAEDQLLGPTKRRP
jgi:AcrR family transcriptional regulator